MSEKRNNQITNIVKELNALKKETTVQDMIYAIDVNIEFFKVARSILSYCKWLLSRARKLDSNKLLEINELLPKYDEEVHRKLIEIERKKFPGLIEPLVSYIFNFITMADNDVIICSLGAGGMEVERQVIERLHKTDYQHNILFIGFDISDSARNTARNNLKTLNFMEITVVDLDSHATDFVPKLNQLRLKNKFTVVLCKENIFSLDKVMPPKSFDLIYSCLFYHHLIRSQGELLESICSKISRTSIEYDGYKSMLHVIPQTLESWSCPVFMNATIFSNLRFPTKAELKHKSNKIQFFKVGTYLLCNKY